MQFKAVLWVWLNPTSAAAVTGGPTAGGQAHIAFQKSGEDVARFFRETAVRKTRNEWRFEVEPYGDIVKTPMAIYENPSGVQRAQECRIPRQSPRSADAHPLWRRAVIQIAPGSEPRQVALFLRDATDKFHLRLLDGEGLHRLPTSVIRRVLAAHRGNGEHVFVERGVFEDMSCPQPGSTPNAEAGLSGLIVGTGPTTQVPDNSPAWEDLARGLAQGAHQQRKHTFVKRAMRDPRVREAALRCFGARCQVRGCRFTIGVPADALARVVHAHHLRSVAKGGSDQLENVAVICANHHSYIESMPGAQVVESQHTDDVVIASPAESLLIERDLSALRDLIGSS